MNYGYLKDLHHSTGRLVYLALRSDHAASHAPDFFSFFSQRSGLAVCRVGIFMP
jgi:hypothetical protein